MITKKQFCLGEGGGYVISLVCLVARLLRLFEWIYMSLYWKWGLAQLRKINFCIPAFHPDPDLDAEVFKQVLHHYKTGMFVALDCRILPYSTFKDNNTVEK